MIEEGLDTSRYFVNTFIRAPQAVKRVRETPLVQSTAVRAIRR